MRKNAVKFRSIDPGDTKFDDLQPLKKLIGDARIVQLGEQSHGDGSCFETKIRLIKFLHQEMGFDVLAFESGIFDCHRAWLFYQSGHDPIDAALQGVFGIWTGSKQTQPLWEYLGEQSKTDSPLELAGFDCQFTASASRAFLVDDLKAFIKNQNIDALSDDELRSFCEQLQGLIIRDFKGSKSDFDEALKKLTDQVSKADSKDDKDLDFWRQNLKSVQAYADYTWKDENDDRKKSVVDRDAQMAENLIWMHQNQFPNRKIIVWAASFHIMRNPSGIEVPSGSVDYSEMVQMGHGVHKALGDKVCTVGFTAYDGTAGAYFRPKFGIGVAPAGTLEDVFVQAEIENGWLSLNPNEAAGKWLNEKMFSRPLGYAWMKANWGQHFDAMVFNREMKPSTQ